MESRRKVTVLGQRMCSSVGDFEGSVPRDMSTPSVQICVLVYTQAALRYTLMKSEVEFILVCSFIKEKFREQDVSIYLTNVFLECLLFTRAWGIAVIKTDKNPCLQGIDIALGETDNKH